MQADLVQRSEREGLSDLIQERAPDLIVNSAGFGLYGEALDHSVDEQLEMLELNGAALLHLSLVAARTLIDRGKRGVILNISSSAGFRVFPAFAVYAASKAFVNSFSEAFDEEVRGRGVRVLTACPGMVNTSFRDRASGGEIQESSSYSMSVHHAARQLWWQVKKEKKIYIFDWKYRFLTFLCDYLIPRRLVTKISRNIIGKRKTS